MHLYPKNAPHGKSSRKDRAGFQTLSFSREQHWQAGKGEEKCFDITKLVRLCLSWTTKQLTGKEFV